MSTIFLIRLIGQQSLNLVTPEIKIWFVVQPLSVYLPRKRIKNDIFRRVKKKPKNGEQISEQINFSLPFS